jgi:hypothetical protein
MKTEIDVLQKQDLITQKELTERATAIEYLERKMQKAIKSYEKKIAALQVVFCI